MLGAWLKVLNGENSGWRFKIEDDVPCSIGRDSGCTICLKDRHVSRRHAVVNYSRGVITLTDIAAGGLRVNGEVVSSGAVVMDGDDITIGSHVFRAVFQRDSEGTGNVEGGGSLASVNPPDHQVIREATPVPAVSEAVVEKFPGLGECIQGMKAIIARHSTDIIRESLKHIFRILPVMRISIFNLSEDGRFTQGYTVYSRAGGKPAEMSSTFAKKVYKARKALLIRDAGDMAESSGSLAGSVGFRDVHCIMGVPIHINGKIRAVLLGDNLEKPDIFTDEHLRIMQFAGRAIEVLYQREAMGKLDHLVNFLPVCDWCKKVRDDDGYWTQLESFVSERAAVRLSRSCCPACAGKMMKS